ncbi:hypothetical protein PGT21_010734 [Puccinia graminis f. sp. tritici]|uniref:Uncharacterized protein n=1 Tax=Puccinia graminis f. sp. tritici TaxID=56615 RepID=A0A5B0S6I3_PUCGR|nr:hypothetical protein PGT21_010734 [Puccinia graminis f. sp. tritici]KAA1133407.1 hypothetical protein PGTUg99_002718 [Puccinia graminis f. sp. tritici]
MQVAIYACLGLSLVLFGPALARTPMFPCAEKGLGDALCVSDRSLVGTHTGAFPGHPGFFFGCDPNYTAYCCPPEQVEYDVKSGTPINSDVLAHLCKKGQVAK